MNGPLVSLCIAKISVCSFFSFYIHSFFIYCNFSFGRCFFHGDRNVFLFLFLVITSPVSSVLCAYMCIRMWLYVLLICRWSACRFVHSFFFFVVVVVRSLAPLNFTIKNEWAKEMRPKKGKEWINQKNIAFALSQIHATLFTIHRRYSFKLFMIFFLSLLLCALFTINESL